MMISPYAAWTKVGYVLADHAQKMVTLWQSIREKWVLGC
jgi:hypothetical protein